MAFYDSNGRDMSASLDRWITGNYGQDQYSEDAFCCTCEYRNYEKKCTNSGNIEAFGQVVDDEDSCDQWQLEVSDPPYDTREEARGEA